MNAWNAAFLEKDTNERCKIFLDSMEARSCSFPLKIMSKILEDTLEQNNSAVIRCMERLDKLNERLHTFEKVPSE